MGMAVYFEVHNNATLACPHGRAEKHTEHFRLSTDSRFDSQQYRSSLAHLMVFLKTLGLDSGRIVSDTTE